MPFENGLCDHSIYKFCPYLDNLWQNEIFYHCIFHILNLVIIVVAATAVEAISVAGTVA